jgi:hypothetical protein
MFSIAHAADPKPRWTWADVKAFVEMHGSVLAAEHAARELKIPGWKFRLAKRCLK